MIKDRKPGFYCGNDLIDNAERKAVDEVMRDQSIFRYYGPNLKFRVDEFERQLTTYFNVSDTVCTSSGTAALKCALKSLNIGYKDEVIVPAYGYVATVNAIVSCNAIPIFCDIDNSMNIDADKIEDLINSNTKAIVIVHIGGLACNLDKIISIAKKHNLAIIEDNAQSFGGAYKGKLLGTFGKLGCFSFQANKIISTGEGGCVISNTKELVDIARIYHDQGGVRYNNSYPQWNDNRCIFGENLRMTEISAAIGMEQLKKLQYILDNLRANKKYILNKINDLDLEFRYSWDTKGDCGSNIVFYIYDSEIREKVLDELQCIHAHKNYNSAMYENLLFQNIKNKYFALDENIDIYEKLKINNCINAEKLSKAAVWIPLSPRYGKEENDEIIETVRKVVMKYVHNC